MAKATKPSDLNHTSAPEARKSKPARRSEEGLRARKESDRLRVKSRINISYSFTRWRRFKEEKKLRTDGDVANYLLNHYEKRSSILLSSTGTCMQEPSHFGCVSASESFEEIEVTIDDDECNSVKSRLSDFDSDLQHIAETTELSAPGAADNCDEDVCEPIIPQSSTTSELLLECEEKELEPWQKHTLIVHLKEEEEARELSDDQTDCKPDSSLHTWLACQHLAFGVVPTFEVHNIRSMMSELFMECVEEELEPWQKQVPEVQLIDDDDDDDEPIFVGVLSNKDDKHNPPPPPQRSIVAKQEIKLLTPKPAVGAQPVMLPLSVTAKAVNNAASNLTTGTPQPVIVNNQGFIVTSPQLANNSEFIASLGSHYPPGTSFTIVPAGQQHLFQQVTSAAVMPRAVHRPQVQQISNNVVTLSNVQSPAVYSAQSHKIHLNPSIPQSVQTFSMPVKSTNINNDQSSVKRVLPPQQIDSTTKRAKIDLGMQKITVSVENGIFKKKCLKCQEEFPTQEALKFHTVNCAAVLESTAQSALNSGTNKRIMLVSEFYYGRFEGDGIKKGLQKPNTTFKCQSCLKVLKNNIRFMNHMKHHLELEKQNSESWESHTTCQHCYRQYLTPFQLQCHIESAHSPIESSTNCKICELAFESEQVLLEHMKDNHKPGEMPYVCQVCNYRSSFFSEVETHFRSVHENTKELLCPFCLKVLRSGHIYMQHYMKHQKKGIHRCGKCRLNFLTYKERVEHRTHYHKTFRKPKALEGLPPGTKVTIRASITAKTSTLQTSPDRSGIIVGTEAASFNQQTKLSVSASRAKSNVSGAGKAKMTQSKKQTSRTTKHNLALKNVRVEGGSYTCVECNTPVNDFFSHFPMFSNCGACKYRTSCKVAIGNHMIRFHSTINKNRFLKMNHKKNSSALKLTLVCLNCDLLVDGSGGDLMTKHLTDRPNHICKVIQEKADMKAKDRVQLFLRQPVKVSYFLTTVPVLRAKEKHLHQEEGVASGSLSVTQDNQPEARPPVAEPAHSATETAVIKGSSESCLTQSLLPVGLPSCTPVLGVIDGLVGVSESVDVREQVPQHETGTTN